MYTVLYYIYVYCILYVYCTVFLIVPTVLTVFGEVFTQLILVVCREQWWAREAFLRVIALRAGSRNVSMKSRQCQKPPKGEKLLV